MTRGLKGITEEVSDFDDFQKMRLCEILMSQLTQSGKMVFDSVSVFELIDMDIPRILTTERAKKVIHYLSEHKNAASSLSLDAIYHAAENALNEPKILAQAHEVGERGENTGRSIHVELNLENGEIKATTPEGALFENYIVIVSGDAGDVTLYPEETDNLGKQGIDAMEVFFDQGLSESDVNRLLLERELQATPASTASPRF